MKSCPNCNRQYTDAWISFCPEDGTVLTEDQASPVREQPPVSSADSAKDTMWLPRQPPEPRAWVAPDERPPMVPVWQPPPPPPYPRGKSQGLAIASMATGLLGLVVGTFCLGPLPGLVALILGIVALTQIKKTPDKIGGKPFALVGVITGGISVLFYGLFLIYIIISAIL